MGCDRIQKDAVLDSLLSDSLDVVKLGLVDYPVVMLGDRTVTDAKLPRFYRPIGISDFRFIALLRYGFSPYRRTISPRFHAASGIILCDGADLNDNPAVEFARIHATHPPIF